MSREYSENVLVQESAGRLLQEELGWDVCYAYDTEVLGKDGTLGRESYHEVLLSRDFRRALLRLNPWMEEAQLSEAQAVLERRLSTASLAETNEEKYFLLRDGITVTVKRPDGRTETKRAAVIDFRHPEENSFLAVKELWIHGDLYRRRTDIVGFVNGIPLLFVELKAFDVDVRNAYDDNYTDYLDAIPQLFYYNAFVMLSNGTEAKVGTLGSPYAFFHEWKRLSEGDAGSVALETMLRGICRKENFLDLFENFILYDHSGGRTAKILARNHQYLGVNAAMQAYATRKLRDGKLGVFWHTQGSGKSYSMVFFAKKILRKAEGTPTFVVLTDRDELNRQLSDTFENCGLLGPGKASQFMAKSGADLLQKLAGNPGFIFTLIQKFHERDAAPILPDHDIIIMSDEAHRSQYGMYAENMMRLLPTASRIGFTGTPLLTHDNITARAFGGYVSVYDFHRAVEDGATVPLYYENRAEKIRDLHNPEITEKILAAVEEADLDEDRQEKLEKDLEREIHILTAEPRLRAIARDFVRHYSDLWTSGKAMFVCLNKVTCVRMYNFVGEYWREEICRLSREMKKVSQQEAQELSRKISWMQETEMAVVISQEQNERKKFADWGLDIEPHRQKMEKRDLDKDFKDPAHPFRIVFVCAMWLTGFDVKCLSCLYMDKLLTAHTLMQAIARANRVSEGKSNGLIVDYIGIIKALRRALADYTVNVKGTEGTDPTIDKEVLIEKILSLIEKTEGFLKERKIFLERLIESEGFPKLAYLQEAANAVCASAQEKKAYLAYASGLYRLMKYADREDISGHPRKQYEAIEAIAAALREKRRHVDNSALMKTINDIISSYVEINEQDAREDERRFDISAIRFDVLRAEFAKAKNKNLLMRDLEAAVRQKLDQMLAANPGRIDYYERYRAIIEAYNAEQDRATIEQTFADLMDLTEKMNEEEKRYVREGLASDEELSLYDLLFRSDLSKKDIQAIKKAAATLLKKIKSRIAVLDHWTDKAETRADVNILIRDTLWTEMPESYSDESLDVCRKKIYEYVYAKYKTVA